MTLINFYLLGGVALTGLPVLLHFMMRARPKRIEFPALRLLQRRQISNARRMRLRHLLLLILRALMIAVAALALTRPSLPAANYGLRWYEWLILGAVVLVCAAVYRWRSGIAERNESAVHLLKEHRGKLRAWTLIVGILAALLFVGGPWGMRVLAEISSPRNPLASEIRVAAVFAFDTSMSMTYKQDGMTRLEQAAEMATEHLQELPQGSLVAVATTHPESEAVFQADLAGVRSRIEDLPHHAVPRSLNAVIRDALNAHKTHGEDISAETGSDQYAREIYLMTDLCESGWKIPDESSLRETLAAQEKVKLYLIDVSVPDPINTALTSLKVDRETATADLDVNVQVSVKGTAAAPDSAILQLFTLNNAGDVISGGGAGDSAQKTTEVGDVASTVNFRARGDAGKRIKRGHIRLANPDPMPFDDEVYFSFGVTEVPNVLFVGDSEKDSRFLRLAMQPENLSLRGTTRYKCRHVNGSSFDSENLSQYDIICITNWRRPPSSAWGSLLRYVEDGGACFVSIGGSKALLDPAAWTHADAISLLPGIPLVSPSFRPEPARLDLAVEDHPVTSVFSSFADAKTELSRAVFFRSWTCEWAEEHRVLLNFTGSKRRPALVERAVGAGRVMLFTGGVVNDPKWHQDFVINDPWAFLMLTDEIMSYLNGSADVRRNFVVGNPVEVSVPANKRFLQYRVGRPRFRLTPGAVEAGSPSVLLNDIDEAGQYFLKAAEEGNTFISHFSANHDDSESDLTALSPDTLDAVLGPGRYSRVSDPQALDRAVDLGRLGIEVFPVMMGLLLILFCCEHLMSNYFYDEAPEPEAA